MTSAPDDRADSQEAGTAGTAVNRAAKGCKAYAVDLSAYFDGELHGADVERVEGHLATCEGCRQALRRLGTLRNALHTLAQSPGGRRSILADLQARLAEEADAEPAPSRPLMA